MVKEFNGIHLGVTAVLKPALEIRRKRRRDAEVEVEKLLLKRMGGFPNGRTGIHYRHDQASLTRDVELVNTAVEVEGEMRVAAMPEDLVVAFS